MHARLLVAAAAKENGGDTDEMEAEAAAVAADEDPTGVLGSLIVEHANLLQRFKMSGWNLEKLRQRARELGFSDDKISATEAAGESNPDSNPKKALLQLILDGLATNMRLRLKNKELVELLEDAKEEGLDLREIQKALDSDNPKAALLALILQRAKAAEGSQVGIFFSFLRAVWQSPFFWPWPRQPIQCDLSNFLRVFLPPAVDGRNRLPSSQAGACATAATALAIEASSTEPTHGTDQGSDPDSGVVARLLWQIWWRRIRCPVRCSCCAAALVSSCPVPICVCAHTPRGGRVH